MSNLELYEIIEETLKKLEHEYYIQLRFECREDDTGELVIYIYGDCGDPYCDLFFGTLPALKYVNKDTGIFDLESFKSDVNKSVIDNIIRKEDE